VADALRPSLEFLVTSPWSRVWPFVALPLVALAFLRSALPRIEADGADPRRQARLAALAACVPGLITLGLTAGLAFRFRGFQPESFDCYVKLFGPLALAGAALTRSGGSLLVRRFRLARLLRYAGPASARLAALAARLDVPVREVPVETSICFVSGFRAPVVVVSTGTVATLSDEQLRTALLHERAHLRSRDGLWSTLVTAVSEFCLFSSARALLLYRASRESLADDEAARQVGGIEVAGVLVRFARNAARIPVAFSLAEPGTLERRVRRLIAPERGAPMPDARATAALLAASAGLALYPAAHLFLERVVLHCGG
jgi:peptidase M48-like protein